MKNETKLSLEIIFTGMGMQTRGKSHLEIENILKEVSQTMPVKLAAGIQRIIERSVRAWEKSNDGKRSEEDRHDADHHYQILTDRVEEIMGLFGIEVDWPGLYPSFMKNGQCEYTVENALKRLL